MDLLEYQHFVSKVTSDESNYHDDFCRRLERLFEHHEINVPLLITGAMGLASESGEFAEILKKVLLEGKEPTEDIMFHMKRELGDIAWYWVNAYRALGFSPDEALIGRDDNRYPRGHGPHSDEQIKISNLPFVGIQADLVLSSMLFTEIVKKILFQGKEPTEDTMLHMKRELESIGLCWAKACRALGLSPDEVIAENVNKLMARYPGGFSAFMSENRKEGDL